MMRLDHWDGINIDGSVIPWSYLAGSAAAAATLVLFSRLLASPTHKNGVPLPPGPPAKWFWESPVLMKQAQLRLTALVEEYGPVVSLRQGSHVIIVIGRMDAATELMEKEGATLADRPSQIAVSELFAGGMSLIFTRAGERFRRLRRAAHTHLQPKVAEGYEEIQAEAAKDVILDVLNDPQHHIQHAQRFSAAVTLRLTYGKTSPTANNDPEVVRIYRNAANFETIMRKTYLVDHIPWLKYVPWYGRQLKEFRRYEAALFRDQMNRVRNDMATNSATPSFAKMLLEHIDDHRLSDDEMAYLAGMLFVAGSSTTASGITVMVMAAACFPGAQARVQEELDEVVRRDRVPTFGDWDMLPQLHAFMLEALRWRPIIPLGVPHRAMKDIIWRGQCIPSGATVIGCHWSISRDPVAFPDPEVFNPQRWLDDDGRVRTDMHFYTYGFGRRVCPGQHVADRSLYINLASLLWAFRISERPDAPINLGPDGLGDVVIFNPEPFEVNFVPRIEEGRLRDLMAN